MSSISSRAQLLLNGIIGYATTAENEQWGERLTEKLTDFRALLAATESSSPTEEGVPMSDRNPRVQGRCPACQLESLFLGDGGHLTCSNLECPMPDTMLAYKIRETGLPFRRRGDRLPTGEEFIGYTDDGTPMWNEPVGPPPPQRIEVDDYEIVNLREGLLALRELGCDTGDWLGQLLNKLPAIEDPLPNATVADQIGRATVRIAHVRRNWELGFASP